MLATSAPEITACKQAVAPRGAGYSDRPLAVRRGGRVFLNDNGRHRYAMWTAKETTFGLAIRS